MSSQDPEVEANMEEPVEETKKSKAAVAAKKRISNLKRKKMDDRYYLNGKGRYVSKKKSENGKKNIQSRSIRLGRKVLGLKGMVLLGKGDDGKALIKAAAEIRQMLKDGKTDEEAEALYTAMQEHKENKA